MAQIKIIEGPNTGEVFELGTGEISLGRHPSNIICVPDNRASRQHARIICQNKSHFIEDLKSANGTVVRGEPIRASVPVKLANGDEFWIGSTRFIFISDDKDDAPSVHDIGGLSIMVKGEEESNPAVNVMLDASRSMMEVGEQERNSDKGLKDAVKRLQAMCQVSNALGTILGQRALMEKIIDCLFDLFPAADRALIMLKGKNDGELVPVAARKRDGDPGKQEEVAVSRTVVNEVVRNRKSVLSSDAQSDDRFSNQLSIVNLAIRSMMCAPLIAGGEILGLMQVDSNRGGLTFTSEDLQILTGIGAQAAISVKNAQLHEAIKTETEKRSSLERYFSPPMVEMMMHGDVNTELGGKNYRGTIFFSDIIGFTPMSEKIPPTEVVSVLNRYFTIMQKIIYANNGNVDKFQGDAIMAFWGIPQTTPEDEYNAILTAVQMQAKVWPFALELQAEGKDPVHMGIGLHTGDFVAGNVGSEDRIEFTLIGDNVNLAARIQSHSGSYRVFVSQATWQAAKGQVSAINLPPRAVKGKSMPISIYSIRGAWKPDGTAVMSIPIAVADSTGKSRGAGLIAGCMDKGADLKLEIYCSAAVLSGETLNLAVDLPEYNDAFLVTATVQESAPGPAVGSGRGGYVRAILGKVQLPQEIEGFFVPGGLVESKRGWDAITRK